MRPRSLEEYVGQAHILGPGKLLTRAIEADRLSSLILYGPPGSGKTTLAQCIQQKTSTVFERVNAVSSNVEELRKIIAGSQNRRLATGRKTVLFIDEIHRFNKAQQDVLMPDLEEGHLILIGATVFNPFFSLVGPLLSRSLVFELKPLSPEDIKTILTRALQDKERGLGNMNIRPEAEALDFLSNICDGDARKALNALEVGCRTTPTDKDGAVHLDIAVAQESIQRKQVNYDRDGDAHYDTASAFIKSMRGSDPDAALYWMAKMIYAGEDPRFIARRICICAAEDVGNADPRALMLATAAMQAAEFIGLPEARIPLAQAAVYVACAPKSNAVYLGIDQALKDVAGEKTQEVPAHLKDASYSGAKKLGRGKDYKYAHDFPGHYVDQEYMPEKKTYYQPTDQGLEKAVKERLQSRSRPSPPAK
ncbi:MAG: replication-associated recombination protein A [Candidatus Omnitrophota bacterium]|nr:replication-associated recombination protein A [Candidatus Omnitrophota bacterium]MDZ4242523.1 replication-associated recombination protein A [Candidatus Omnitrophota bacterium]